MRLRIITASMATAATLLSAIAVGNPVSPYHPPPIAQTNPWPNAQPDYRAGCRSALQKAETNLDKTSAANIADVQRLISHARDSEARGYTFQCLNEANDAIDHEN
jgi:hypothetical protein